MIPQDARFDVSIDASAITTEDNIVYLPNISAKAFEAIIAFACETKGITIDFSVASES